MLIKACITHNDINIPQYYIALGKKKQITVARLVVNTPQLILKFHI